jgi:hypothetical protein
MKFRILSMLVAIAVALTATSIAQPASAHSGGPHVRLAHLAPTAPSVDVYINDQVVPSLDFKEVTDYLQLEGHEFEVFVVPAGKPQAEAVNKEALLLTFEEGDNGFYTVAAVGALSDNSFQLVTLKDNPPAEKATAIATTADASKDNIEIKGAFARATAGKVSGHGGSGGMAMGNVSAAYMTIMNKGEKADRLVSATSDVAGKVETHETVIKNDVAQMLYMPEGFEVPAGGMIELKPGGKHLMLRDLTRNLVAGETLMLTLTFESGTVIEFAVPIVQS